MRYLVFDIGCIECGESSNVVGLFNLKKEAEEALSKAQEEQKKHWTGQHSFEIFEIESHD